MPLYDDPTTICSRVDTFVANRQSTISDVFNEQRQLPQTRSAFMFQPGVLMLYERLEHDALAVREAWGRAFPERELERVALAFGISFD